MTSAPVPPDWAAVRVAYETSTDTVATIATRFRIKPWRIKRQAKLDGWTLRPSGRDMLRLVHLRADVARLEALTSPIEAAIEDVTAVLPPLIAPETKAQTRGIGSAKHRAQLVRQFFTVLDLKIQELEKRVTIAKKKAASKKPSVTAGADSERDTRMLTQALKLYENLCDNANAPAKTTTNATSSEAIAEADLAESRRAEIRERIERIMRTPAPQPDTRPTDPT